MSCLSPPNIRIQPNFLTPGTTVDENSPNAFEKDRLENAAVREQRGGQNRGMTNGRAGGGGALSLQSNNQVRFTDNPAVASKESPSSKQLAPSPSQFGAPATTPFNPFAPTQKGDLPVNTFGTLPAPHKPFGAPSQPATAMFGTAQGGVSERPSTNGVQKTSLGGVFGAPSAPFSNNSLGGASSNGIQGSSSNLHPFSTESSPKSFGGPSTSSFSNSAASSSHTAPKQGGLSGTPAPNFGTFGVTVSSSKSNGFISNATSPTPSLVVGHTSSSALAEKMDKLLQKEGITQPLWPTSSPGDPKQKAAVESFWQTSKAYRTKVRASLIRAGLLDDPDKPKKLSEAIDFKGTCEDMCPEFEKVTRIMEHDVQGPEKEIAPDGSLWPAPQKMVKALARSAAGQDAPLPMDVRSPAALRRTLNYLMETVLGDDANLPSVHGFLWDRTRAIRRDFVFQSSMNASELGDQVYCLERITRFHVIALHQMSNGNVVAEDFSEQQEVEQLGKALLSLVHAYEDCNAQDIVCENEAEFRAYYVLFNSHNSGILETVQDWGWKFWGKSDEVRIAVSLVEALQNIWDTLGPLKPLSATDISQNAFSRFFSIVEDKQVSYTMACFAEIHFNNVRKSALKTILASYRKQRDQTKDWTLAKLNTYLWFDDEEDIISFAEAYGAQFDETDGEVYLSFESGDTVTDPFPPLKQQHSHALVERKRGNNSLSAVIDKTVFEQDDSERLVSFGDKLNKQNRQPDKEPTLFVKDDTFANGINTEISVIESTSRNKNEHDGNKDALALIQDSHVKSPVEQTASPTSVSSSLFDRVATPPKQFGSNFFSQSADKSSFRQPQYAEPLAPLAAKPTNDTLLPVPKSTSASLSSGTTDAPSKPFSFLTPRAPSVPSVEPPQKSIFQGSYSTTSIPTPVAAAAPQFSFGNNGFSASSDIPSATAALPSFATFGGPAKEEIIPPQNKTSQPSFPSTTPNSGQGTLVSFQPPSRPSQIQAKTAEPTSMLPASSPIPDLGPQIIQTSDISSFKQPNFVDRKEKLSKFSNWFATGDHGLIDHFTAFTVEQIVKTATKIFMDEEAERIAREADVLAKEEADKFRYRSLASRYGRLWREAAHRKWLRRRGREARKARQEMAESLRASKTAQSANIVQDFKSSTINRRNSLASILDATGVLSGVHDTTAQIRAIVQDEIKKSGDLVRRKSERSNHSPSSSTSRTRRDNSVNPLRRSLMSDPSYLNGGSRIHLMSRYGAEDEERRQVSGVQTDYFRLKARGITTLPNGTPLASSVANAALRKKHSFDNSRPVTPEVPKQLTIPRSAPATNRHDSDTRIVVDREEDLRVLKNRARAVMAGEQWPQSKERKRSLDDVDDEELFARAKRIREQMDEGVKWFRSEIERSRSIS